MSDFQCEFCQSIFPTEKKMRTHQDTARYCIKIQKSLEEIPVRRYTCEICGEKFNHVLWIKVHERDHKLHEQHKKIIRLETELSFLKEQNDKEY